MKTPISFILLIMFATVCRGQYGQEGAILGGAEAVIRVLELSELDKIAESQNEILTYHAAIAVSTAEIVRIEQRMLDSQTDLRPWVENLSSVIRVGVTATQLAEIQQQILDVAQNVPEMIPFVSEAMINIILDAGVIVTDFGIALKESPTNLLNNADRIKVINNAQDGLDYLVNESLELYRGMQAIASLALFEGQEGQDYQYDASQAIDNAAQRIENFIQD